MITPADFIKWLETFKVSYGPDPINGRVNSGTAGQLAYYAEDGTALSGLSLTPTAQQLLMSGASTTPQWSTTTYPLTNAINTIMYASSANTLGVITPVNSAGLLTNSSGVPAWVAATGTGAPVLANTPTLIAPVLGAATATSINFGDTSLSNYKAAIAFTPTMTCATPGNLSVTYQAQTGYYTRIGNVAYVHYEIGFTPTFTTASGIVRFSALPFTVNGTLQPNGAPMPLNYVNSFVWPAGITQINPWAVGNNAYIQVYLNGTTANSVNLTMANLVTGTPYYFVMSGFYFI
jgi:hypothetical protein